MEYDGTDVLWYGNRTWIQLSDQVKGEPSVQIGGADPVHEFAIACDVMFAVWKLRI